MSGGGDIVRARSLLEQARRVVVLTGAGISTDSGIADFRGPQGIWTKNPEAEKMATLAGLRLGPPAAGPVVAEPPDLIAVVSDAQHRSPRRW